MIARLKGTVAAVELETAVIDVGGVGYLVSCPGRALAKLQVGQPATLWVETVVREDAILLYGFLAQEDKAWFRRLTTVQGVGAKVALAILSVLAPDALARAIAAQDKAALGRASGVGPKLAARILSELKDKAVGLATGPAFAPAASAAAPEGEDARAKVAREATSALVNLGYGASDAFAVVSAAIAAAGEAVPTVEQAIAAALKEIARAQALTGRGAE